MPVDNACFYARGTRNGLTRIDWLPGTVCGIYGALAIDLEIEALGRDRSGAW